MRIWRVQVVILNIKVTCYNKDIIQINLNIFSGRLLIIRVNVDNETNNTSIKEWNEIDISVIKYIFPK